MQDTVMLNSRMNSSKYAKRVTPYYFVKMAINADCCGNWEDAYVYYMEAWEILGELASVNRVIQTNDPKIKPGDISWVGASETETEKYNKELFGIRSHYNISVDAPHIERIKNPRVRADKLTIACKEEERRWENFSQKKVIRLKERAEEIYEKYLNPFTSEEDWFDLIPTTELKEESISNVVDEYDESRSTSSYSSEYSSEIEAIQNTLEEKEKEIEEKEKEIEEKEKEIEEKDNALQELFKVIVELDQKK